MEQVLKTPPPVLKTPPPVLKTPPPVLARCDEILAKFIKQYDGQIEDKVIPKEAKLDDFSHQCKKSYLTSLYNDTFNMLTTEYSNAIHELIGATGKSRYYYYDLLMAAIKSSNKSHRIAKEYLVRLLSLYEMQKITEGCVRNEIYYEDVLIE